VPNGVLVDDTGVTAINFSAGSIGIRVGVTPTTSNEVLGTIRACSVVGFDTGIKVSGVGRVVSGCNVVPGAGGAYGIEVITSSDIVVAGCRVDCSVNGGLIGLRANGDATDTVVGLKVIDNTFYGAADYGIQLRGYVQESVVRGNVVDCNLPGSPNDPTAIAGIYVNTVNATDVPGYLTISGNTVWRSKTGIYLNGTQAGQIAQVNVVDNVVHHCAVGIAGAPVVIGDTSLGIGADWCVGLIVSSNNVYGIGKILTDAGTEVFPTGADVYSIGVFTQDATHTTVVGNQVRAVYSNGAGTGYGVQWYGSGTAAGLTADGVNIDNNGVDSAANTGILVAVGVSGAAATNARILRGAQVSGNTVSNCGDGIIVRADDRGTVSDLRFEGNSVSITTSGAGILLAAYDATTVPGTVNRAQVVSNTINSSSTVGIDVFCDDNATMSYVSVDQNAVRQPGTQGVRVKAGTPGAAGVTTFEYITVSNNTVRMSAVAGAEGILAYTVATTVNDVRVSGNSVSNTSIGISLAMVGPGAVTTDTSVTDLYVTGNTVTATLIGMTTTVTGTMLRHTVADNNIESDAITYVTSLSSVAGASSAQFTQGVTISRNRFQTVAGGTNTVFQTTNTKLVNVLFDDNNFLRGLGGGAALYIEIGMDSSLGNLPAVRGLRVHRNTFRDTGTCALFISVPGPTDAVTNVDITENLFNLVARGAGIARASVVRCSAAGLVENLAVRSNQFLDFGHSTTTYGGIDLEVGSARGIDVSDNLFNVGTGVPDSFGTVVNLNLEPTATAGNLYDVSVCRNKSRQVIVPSGATDDTLISLNLNGFLDVGNVSVCDNDLERRDNGAGDTGGIRVQADAAVRGFACDRNRITGADATPITKTAIFPVFSAGVQGLSVCSNYVGGASPLGAQGTGIRVSLGADSDSMRVSDNTILGDPGTSARGLTVIGIAANLDATNLNVDRNHVDGYEDNIVVEVTNGTNVSVSGNQVTQHTTSGIGVYGTSASGTVFVAMRNLVINDNAVSTTTDTQSSMINVQMTNNLPIQGLSVCDNTVQFRRTSILSPAYANGTAINVEVGSTGTVALENAQICQNNIRYVDEGIVVASGDNVGIRIDGNTIRGGLLGVKHSIASGGSADTYSISGNTVEVNDASTVDGLIHVEFLANNLAFNNATINNNNVDGSGYGGEWGIRVGNPVVLGSGYPAARNVSVSGNQVRSTDRGVGIGVQSGQSIVIDRNTVSDVQYTGVNLLRGSATYDDVYDVSFSHNVVTDWNVSAAAVTDNFGFGIQITGSSTNAARNITAVGNTCHTTNNNATGWYIKFFSDCYTFIFASNAVSFAGTAGTLAMDLNTGNALGATTNRNFVFTGNVFRGSANGITYTSTGGIPSQCTFMGNIGDTTPGVTFSWSNFAVGGGFGWLNVLPPAGAGAGQFSALNIDNGT
jgi:Right handed beta helix region